MTEKTTIDDLIFEIECMTPAGETGGIPYLRLGKADLLHKLNAIKGQSDHQQTFEVGEYYVNKLGDIIKIRSIESGTVYYDYLKKGGNKILVTQGVDSQLKFSPATAEQIAEFKRAEHFASKGRKLDDFKTDDICTFRGRVVLIQGLDGAGDLWFYGNQFGEEYLSKEELKHLTLIQILYRLATKYSAH